MVLDLLFLGIFILAIVYLIRYQVSLTKAAEISHRALYPNNEQEFASILIPHEWKRMEPLTKTTKSYLYVKWGTIAVLIFLTSLIAIVLWTDWLDSVFFSFAYFFYMLIKIIPHKGSLFILQEGVIFNGRTYSTHQIKGYEVEEIIRWHELYGLDDRVNYGFKLTLHLKNTRFFEPNFVVVTDEKQLEKILRLLNGQGITGGFTGKESANEHIQTRNG